MVVLLFLAIYKASAVWISLRSMLGCARGTSVFEISCLVLSLAPPPTPPPRPRQKKNGTPATQSIIGDLF